MARPRPNNKSAKQRGGAGAGKRKLVGAPIAGGASARPAKQSRREGKSKRADEDIFEAEDSDPDEVKHAERFDQVDNYEYELPSDFEDEEIDEELAFTEEDKKKFGSWFEKEVSADGEDFGVGDDDGEGWDDGDEGDEAEEGEDDNDDLDEDDDERKAGGVEDTGDLGTDDDLDALLGDDEPDDDFEDGGDALDDDDEEDEERHRAMLREVLGEVAVGEAGVGAFKRARRDPNAAVVSEAYPESEYNLNPGAASAGGASGSLSVVDLLRSLTAEEKRKLGSARKLLEKVAGAGAGAGRRGKAAVFKPVAVPLPTIVAERQERRAGYEAASKDVTKWQPLVKANREAPTLRLVAARDEVPRVTTTAALVAQHIPSADNALEAEVAALLQAAGAASSEAIEEAEEKLALKALSLEEARERRNRLAKLRSLLFYHELKAKRLKSIKSKEYHRHLARAAKRKASKLAAATEAAGGADGDGEPDAERVVAIEAEFQRAKERLTLRHRNSSRWARRALKRGQLQVDEGTKAALAEQLQLGQQLKRKIEGRKGSGSDGTDSDGSTSASDGEQEGDKDRGGVGGLERRAPGGRVRSAALELLAGGGSLDLAGEDAPKKGLLALPFMKRAMEKRKLEAQQQAEEMLRELDEQEAWRAVEDGPDGEGNAKGRGPEDEEAEEDGEEKAAGAGGLLERLVGYSVPAAATGMSGRRKFGGGADAAAANDDASDDDDDSDDGESDDVEDAEAKAERLGRKSRDTKRQQQQQAAAAAKQKGGKKGSGAAAAAPPSAADQADLDAVLAAGAAGRGLLVASSDAAIDLAVPSTAVADAETDAAAAAAGALERRRSGHAATTSRGGGGVLADAAAHAASLAPGGGRAALFEGSTAAAAKAAGAAPGGKKGAAAATPKFMLSKTFAGPRPGYMFKRGPQGMGYYLDPKAQAAAAAAGANGAAAPAAGKQQQQPGGKRKGKGKGAMAAVVGAAADEPAGPEPVKVAGQPSAAPAATAPADAAAGSGRAAKRRKGFEVAAAADGDGGNNSDDADEPIMKPAPGGVGGGGGRHQRDLIRQAFAGDDVEAEFAEEKAAAVAAELPAIEEPSKLPGWGAWSAQQGNPRWMQAAKEKAAKQRAEAAAGRKDANNKYVIISEKWDKKAAKYTTPQAPFPFDSRDAYERSIRQPLGRDFNPDASFRDLTRPAVLKQSGVVIAPLKFREAAAKKLGRKGAKAAAARDNRKVMTVAGGVVNVGGKK